MQKGTIDSYQLLANAIVLQATTDYRNSLAGIGIGKKSAEDVARECERFFRSEYFGLLTKVSGEYLIEKLKKEVQDEHYPNSTDTQPH